MNNLWNGIRCVQVFAATSFLLTATPVAAQWAPNTSEYSCGFQAEYGNAILRFGVSRQHDYVSITVWDSDWKSIVKNKSYPIDIFLDGTYFGRYQADGMRTTLGSTGLFLSIDGKAKFRLFTHAAILEFRTNNKIVGRFSLAGVASAFDKALACVASGDGVDPFST